MQYIKVKIIKHTKNYILWTKFSYRLLNKINIITYFKNLTVELHVLYALNTYVKFYVNKILFTICSINLNFMHNFKLQKFAI